MNVTNKEPIPMTFFNFNKAAKVSLIAFSATFAASAVMADSYSYSNSTSKKSKSAKGSVTQIGEVLTTKAGLTLYTFAKDKKGVSNCYGGCAQNWPPYLAKGYGSGPKGAKKIKRKDGTKQWAIDGMPLYTWVGDSQPGDINGQGIKNVWFVARADDAPVKVFNSNLGNIITDNQSHSLYTFKKDGPNSSSCVGQCAVKWPPLFAQKSDRATAPFSIFKRQDGKYQWAYNQQPLYSWINDQQPGDTSGNGVGGVWDIATY